MLMVFSTNRRTNYEVSMLSHTTFPGLRRIMRLKSQNFRIKNRFGENSLQVFIKIFMRGGKAHAFITEQL
jgi:hypothetical protein